MRGLGAPALRGGRRGDLMIEVNVDVPTQLTAEEAELLAQFAAMRGEQVSSHPDGLFSRLRSAFKT
jgi:molecular chaperone DnaJ